MKQTLLFLSALLLTTHIAAAQVGSTANTRVTQKTLQPDAENLDIELNIESLAGTIKSGQWVTIVPVLVRDNYRQPLPAVLFYRHERGALLKRSGKLSPKAASGFKPYAEQVVKRNKNSSVTYRTSLPSLGWTPNPHIEIEQTIKTWTGKVVSRQTFPLLSENQAIHPNQPYALVGGAASSANNLGHSSTFDQNDALISKEGDQSSSKAPTIGQNRAESGSAQIDFRIGSSVIDLQYMNNLEQIVELRKSINKVLQDKSATINRITLLGYSSPEGSEQINDELAYKRVDALKRYIQNAYGFGRDIIDIEWVGEDWDELKKLVGYSNMPKAGLVIDIIDNFPNIESRKSMLRLIDGGSVYEYLRTAFFPLLRRVEYRIDYTTTKNN